MSDKDKAKRLFKQIKAGIKKWEDLNDDDLSLMLRYYPNLFPCHYIIDENLACGNTSAVIIVVNNKHKIPACKSHYARLSLALLHKGNEIRWIKKYRGDKNES